MAPPGKRQKRPVVLSSDNETLDIISTHKTIPSRSRARSRKSKTGRTRIVTEPDPVIFPTDRDAKPKPVGKVQTSRPISSFFRAENSSAGTQGQQPSGQQPAGSVTAEVEYHEDPIVDDSPVENVDDGGRTNTRTTLDRRKRHPAPAHDPTAAKSKSGLQGGSQRFKFPEQATSMDLSIGKSGVVKTRSTAIDLRPWAEKYGPNSLEELVVHKKKVSDVRVWLENVLRGQDHKRLLILKGPSGAGKTATISMLAKALNVDVLEWKNPVGSEFSSEAYLSISAYFEDFLGRSGKFNKLALADITGDVSATPSPAIDALSGNRRERIILIEEFPNTFLGTSSALRSFRSSVLQYLARNTPSMGALQSTKPNVTPLVMIITETQLTTSTAASDSFTAHRLLGPEILSHPSVSTIEFNPVASTYLTKALDLLVQKEARQSGRRRVPGPAVLKSLGEVGDIRSAVGSLEFLCLRSKDGDDWGGRVASRAKKGASTSSEPTKMETESLAMITQRESTLGLFHAVGKVVYNKRDDFADGNAAGEPPTQPPHHLSGHVRLRMPQVSAEQLIDETGTDVATFVAALHENFVLSCEGNSFIDHLDSCMDALSDSDVLGSLRGDRFSSSRNCGNRSLQGATADTMRQDEICFHVAVRGLLFALPDPVKRQTPLISGKSGCKSDTYRMFYPNSMRLSRQVEEMGGLVGQWTARIRASAVQAGKAMGKHGRQFTYLPLGREARSTAELRSQSDGNNPEHFRTGLGCTKSELIVDRLPYVTKIEQRNAASACLDELERITHFHSITPPGHEASEDENMREGAPFSDWTTDDPAEGDRTVPAPRASLQHKVEQAGKEAGTLVLPVGEEVGQLYLSDDDIEDD